MTGSLVNHLFENNNEDYDRVISQLNTMDSLKKYRSFKALSNQTTIIGKTKAIMKVAF